MANVASIRVDGAQIATMHFVLDVGRPADIGLIPATLTMHRNAFASYASEDRDHVIARVQGMEKAGLNVFVDVTTLRSGEDWEAKLWRVIPESDVFYLFWCRHAKNSPWVEKEWRCALRERGLDFIDPVPLEAPEHATPPPELASKHFNDPLLYFLSSRDHPLKSSSAST